MKELQDAYVALIEQQHKTIVEQQKAFNTLQSKYLQDDRNKHSYGLVIRQGDVSIHSCLINNKDEIIDIGSEATVDKAMSDYVATGRFVIPIDFARKQEVYSPGMVCKVRIERPIYKHELKLVEETPKQNPVAPAKYDPTKPN